jgi:hypothetical protein
VTAVEHRTTKRRRKRGWQLYKRDREREGGAKREGEPEEDIGVYMREENRDEEEGGRGEEQREQKKKIRKSDLIKKNRGIEDNPLPSSCCSRLSSSCFSLFLFSYFRRLDTRSKHC